MYMNMALLRPSACLAPLLLLWGADLDEVVNAQDRDGGLRCKLERLDLAHGRLEHTGSHVVDHLQRGQGSKQQGSGEP